MKKNIIILFLFSIVFFACGDSQEDKTDALIDQLEETVDKFEDLAESGKYTKQTITSSEEFKLLQRELDVNSQNVDNAIDVTPEQKERIEGLANRLTEIFLELD